jgi:hypothetical protein
MIKKLVVCGQVSSPAWLQKSQERRRVVGESMEGRETVRRFW